MPKAKLKAFNAENGVLLDHNFDDHRNRCARCAEFDAKKPSTAAAMCLEGAVLYKRDNAERRTSAPAARPDTYASKAEMKRAMRYKGG